MRKSNQKKYLAKDDAKIYAFRNRRPIDMGAPRNLPVLMELCRILEDEEGNVRYEFALDDVMIQISIEDIMEVQPEAQQFTYGLPFVGPYNKRRFC